LSSHRSGPSASSHVDQGPDAVNPSHPAYDVVRALADGAATIQEARVAMAMALSEDGLKGFRHIEEASGLTDDTLLKVIPQAGASTTLLSCTNRGKFAYEEEDRRTIDLHLRRYVSPAGHHWSLSSNSLNDQRSRGSNDLVDVEEEPSGVRQMSKDVLALLDPSLDLWNNATEGCAKRQEFGDAGWALAVVTGMQATELALDELCRITRVGERQVRRIIDRLAESGWARRIREGRRVRIVVDFSPMAHEENVSMWTKTVRKARKALVHQRESGVIKRLGSKIGWDMKEMWQSRKTEVRMLRDWAEETGSYCWDRLIWIFENVRTRWEGEQALFEYFRPHYPVTEEA
jgi:transcription initiation factor IIE alpha subunit